jgi:hypothetical protein
MACPVMTLKSNSVVVMEMARCVMLTKSAVMANVYLYLHAMVTHKQTFMKVVVCAALKELLHVNQTTKSYEQAE